MERGAPIHKETLAKATKILSLLVGEKEGRLSGVDSKTEVDQTLDRRDLALNGGDKVCQFEAIKTTQ